MTFGLVLPALLGKTELWPGYEGLFIRQGDAPEARQATLGRWGLVPHWAKDANTRHTFNARSETVATKPSFRDAWLGSQRCIIPASTVFEPDWRSGRALPNAMARADGTPMGLAGLWSAWRKGGDTVLSYSMLTVNADNHAIMRHLHKPDEEKRMVVVLDPANFDDWLSAKPQQAALLLRQTPAQELSSQTLAAPFNARARANAKASEKPTADIEMKAADGQSLPFTLPLF